MTYLPPPTPQQGVSKGGCPTCGVTPRNQHTLGESALCDGIRNGHLDRSGNPILKQEVVKAA